MSYLKILKSTLLRWHIVRVTPRSKKIIIVRMIEYNHLHQEDMTNLLAEANRIMDLLEKEFVFPDGSLFLEKSKTGGIFYHHIFPDLGDFIPYFLYFGRKPFVYGQIDHYKKNLKDGYLIS